MTSTIESLADAIAKNTAIVGQFLRTSKMAAPSFDYNGPTSMALHDANAEIAKQVAIESCIELIDLLQGPQMCFRPCLNGAPLQIVYRYRLAQQVPLGGLVSFADLASSCGMAMTDLRAVVRFVIVFHRCFCEPVEGMVGHSAASRQLLEDPNVNDGVGQMFDAHQPAYARLYDSIEQTKGQRKAPDNTAYALAHACKGIFEHHNMYPQLAARYQGAMKFFMSTSQGMSPDALVNYSLWGDLPVGSIVVDIGGGDGYVGRMLARAYPGLRIVVQDQQNVIEPALASEEASSSVKLQVSDFFQPQSVQHADVYLFKWVLHDWPDNLVVEILRALIPALKSGSKVVVNDHVGPGQVGRLPYLAERLIRELDLVVLATLNSYERELRDWQRVFKKADPRFGAVRCKQPAGTLMSILEVDWDCHT